MKHLWAPWRMTYIRHAAEYGCFFCRFIRARDDKKNLILERGRRCFAILNRFPYTPGHLMVAPVAHKGRLPKLSPDEIAEMWEMVVRMQERIDRVMKPHGYNIGINQGRIAGAGVPGHVHIHIVPRWKGDSNFMPVTGGAKVMPMLLSEIYDELTGSKSHAARARAPARRGKS